MNVFWIKVCVLLSVLLLVAASEDEEDAEAGEEDLFNDDDPYKTTDPRKREPSPCEVCKFFTTELRTRLKETDTKEIIRIGHGLDKKKEFPYKFSELRLTEALQDPHICEKILQYQVHAERKGSLRYAKGQSETMSTLHGLVDKGVKVELGIPYDLWDSPSAEVSKMQRKCFKLAEEYEEDIEDWYYNMQETDLIKYLCADRYLKGKDQACLKEQQEDKTEKKKKRKKKSKKSKKGDVGQEIHSAEHEEL